MTDYGFSQSGSRYGNRNREEFPAKKTGSRLFLTEFLIVLFFFLIVSTVCLKLFVRSHQITESAAALSHGQTMAASAAAVLAECDGSAAALAFYFPEAEVSGELLTMYYDRDFQPCTAESARYTMIVSTECQGYQKLASIHFFSEDSMIYELNVTAHQPLTRGEVLP